MTRLAFMFYLALGFCQLAYAERPLQVVVESCLLGKTSAKHVSVTTSGFGYSWTVEDISKYELMWPSAVRGVRIGYATSNKGENDYIFVGKYRGFIKQAIPLSDWKPERVEPPQKASYGVVRHAGKKYVCVVTAPGQGSAAFVRVGYVGAFPPKNGGNIQLYYVIADIKKYKAFGSG